MPADDFPIGRGWKPGDALRSSPGRTHAVGGWEVESEEPLADPLAAHVHFILDRIAPHLPAVIDAAHKGVAVLSIALYVSSGATTVGTVLSRDQISILADLGAAVDVDTYDFAPQRE